MPNIEQIDVQTMIGADYQPILTNHWTLEFNGFPAFIFFSADRPTWAVNKNEISYMNKIRKVAGKTKYDDWKITLKEPVIPSIAQQCVEWLRVQYEIETGRQGYKDWYAKDLYVKLSDGPGFVIQKWLLKRAWITQFSPSGLNYEDDKPTSIDLTLTYDESLLIY